MRLNTWRFGTFVLLFVGVLSSAVRAVPPTPLESAYWRFEEGTASGQVTPRNSDVVLDSINDNEMRAFMDANVDASPTYVSMVPDKPLKSSLPNTLALDFIPNQDIYADQQDINNGIIATGGGFTVEGAFRTNNPARFAGIVGKEGRPALGKLGGAFDENLQTFVVKTRADNSLLQVELWDGGAVVAGETPKQVSSLAALNAAQWYYFAVVNDGSMLALWLDSGSGYELQGSTALSGGALYQGDDPNNPDWDRPWTIGRGEFGGGPADFFDGIIDEVRISNTALSPSQFLFAAPSVGIQGDYNENGTVDAADYVVWRKNLNQSVTIPNDATPGMVSQEDYGIWRQNFGRTSPGLGAVVAAPEPGSVVLCVVGIAVCSLRRSSRKLSVELVS
jgi:hypothetical protein